METVLAECDECLIGQQEWRHVLGEDIMKCRIQDLLRFIDPAQVQ
jgi:hypothetical protein